MRKTIVFIPIIGYFITAYYIFVKGVDLIKNLSTISFLCAVTIQSVSFVCLFLKLTS